MLNENFFIPATVEERPITLDDGTVHVLHFRHLDVATFELFAMQTASRDDTVASHAAARLVVAGLCTPDGKPALKLEDAIRIKRPVFRRIFDALLDVNSYGKKAADEGNL